MTMTTATNVDEKKEAVGEVVVNDAEDSKSLGEDELVSHDEFSEDEYKRLLRKVDWIIMVGIAHDLEALTPAHAHDPVRPAVCRQDVAQPWCHLRESASEALKRV